MPLASKALEENNGNIQFARPAIKQEFSAKKNMLPKKLWEDGLAEESLLEVAESLRTPDRTSGVASQMALRPAFGP
jgi:hypothetical protein